MFQILQFSYKILGLHERQENIRIDGITLDEDNRRTQSNTMLSANTQMAILAQNQNFQLAMASQKQTMARMRMNPHRHGNRYNDTAVNNDHNDQNYEASEDDQDQDWPI